MDSLGYSLMQRNSYHIPPRWNSYQHRRYWYER